MVNIYNNKPTPIVNLYEVTNMYKNDTGTVKT